MASVTERGAHECSLTTAWSGAEPPVLLGVKSKHHRRLAPVADPLRYMRCSKVYSRASNMAHALESGLRLRRIRASLAHASDAQR